jgi:hypothetical protein
LTAAMCSAMTGGSAVITWLDIGSDSFEHPAGRSTSRISASSLPRWEGQDPIGGLTLP